MIRKAPVIVCEREFAVQIWEPGDPVMTDDRLGIDTETELLISGAPIRPVCVQAASPEKQLVQIAMHPHIDAYFSQLLQANANAVLYMHNAPFDCTVLGLLGSDMLHGWIENNQLVDTCIRFILHALREGSFTGKFSLDTAAKQVLHYQMQGKKKNQAEESVRLSFKQGVEPTDEQLTYAAIDPVVTVLLGEVMHQQLPTEMIQLRGFFGLHWISRRGLLVDTKRLAELKETFQARMAEKAFVLNCFGYYPGDAGNRGVLQHILQVFEKHTGAILPRTEKTQARQINAGINACFEAACGRVPEFVRALRDSDHCAKMLSTYLNEELIGVDGRVHSFFAPLVKTGRTSSSRPNIQNIPRTENIRSIYRAAPGMVLFANDYSQIELCALAQSCYSRFGYSRMRELINDGVDLHDWFGQIIKKYDKRPDELKSSDKEFRRLAKVPNFGLPGGLGAVKLVEFARNTYGVQITVEEAQLFKELWLEAFPEMARHLRPAVDNYFSYGDEQWYIAETINGRISRKASYNSACNYPLIEVLGRIRTGPQA